MEVKLDRPEVLKGTYVKVGETAREVLARRVHTCLVDVDGQKIFFPVTELVVTEPSTPKVFDGHEIL